MSIRTAIKPLGSSGVFIDKTPIRFDYIGKTQTYQVPKGCKKLHIDCVGGTDSGKGGRVQCILSVTANQLLYVVVAQASASGYNASDIRTIENDLSSRLIVAGGGGAKGNDFLKEDRFISLGGNGGGLEGQSADKANNYSASEVTGGGGGTQTAGGKTGVKTKGYGYYAGKDGSFGLGGTQGIASSYRPPIEAGAGGSGWYGGGGGSVADSFSWGNPNESSSGGGGGSSYTDPNLCSEVEHTQGFNEGTNGYIIITPIG